MRTIIVETANRFARDLIVQETGHRMLKAQGIEIMAVDSPGAFVEDTLTATLVRQVLGAVAQFDKAMTVAKLRLARDSLLIVNFFAAASYQLTTDKAHRDPGARAHGLLGSRRRRRRANRGRSCTQQSKAPAKAPGHGPRHTATVS